jgi:hypothetical protein
MEAKRAKRGKVRKGHFFALFASLLLPAWANSRLLWVSLRRLVEVGEE